MRASIGRILITVLLAGVLAACAGSKGDPGATGATGSTGATGPTSPGANSAVPLATAQSLAATFTGVTVAADTKATVRFTLKNERDEPVKGLLAPNIRLIIAQLRAGTGGKGSEWRSYPTTLDNGKVQATAEVATTSGAVFTDNGDGTYAYTFSKALNAYGANAPTYDASLVHRVGLELRSTTGATAVTVPAANNAPYTFVPATGATTNLPVSREVVSNKACDACHDRLEFHGGPRTDAQYCVMCHNPSTTDGQAPNNSLDMAVMVHKIHMGTGLTKGYKITGYGNTVYEFGEIAFTQDPRNCLTCHQENNAETPQASNWRNVPYSRACGACHDDIDFAAGVGHEIATDDQCVTCHGPNSPNAKLRPDQAHVQPEVEARKQFKYELVKVRGVDAAGNPVGAACAAATVGCQIPAGSYPLVTVKLSNPVTGAIYKVTDAPVANGRAIAYVATDNQNFVNRGSSTAPTPIQIDFRSTAAAPAGAPPQSGPAVFDAATGTYTKAASAKIAANVTGSGTVFLGGRVSLDINPFDPWPNVPVNVQTVGIPGIGVTFPITDATAVARRSVVDVKRCDDCHKFLNFHGEGRNENTELCSSCHNPEYVAGATLTATETDATGSVVNTAASRPWDFKVLVHGIHAATYNRGAIQKDSAGKFIKLPSGDYKRAVDFTEVGYPGQINNCEGCHKPNTYYPVEPTKVFGTSMAAGATSAVTDDMAISPNAAICSQCHTTETAKLHMEQNGSDLNRTGRANKLASGQLDTTAETCVLCHGAGSTADVKVMHKIGEFKFSAPRDQ